MPIDLIILAFIAGFILYRLYATLGEQTGFDEAEEMELEQAAAAAAPSPKPRRQAIEEIDASIRNVIQQMTKLDPEFSLKEFREGASWAFEMIIDAFAKSNTEPLKQLLSKSLFQQFAAALKERAAQGYTFENTLVKIESDEVVEATLKGSVAHLKVKFVSEQIPLLKDKNGVVIEGNVHQIDQVVEYWTFERNLTSDDPNWILISTEV